VFHTINTKAHHFGVVNIITSLFHKFKNCGMWVRMGRRKDNSVQSNPTPSNSTSQEEGSYSKKVSYIAMKCDHVVYKLLFPLRGTTEHAHSVAESRKGRHGTL
jgi:hypothetical protein